MREAVALGMRNHSSGRGFTAAGVYQLAAPYTQTKFSWRYFPNDTSDMGDLAHGMSLQTSSTAPVIDFHMEFIYHSCLGGKYEAW